MGDEAQIDDELHDRIYECMLQRLRDKYPIVRVHAVFALGRLQDPTDQDCPIINGKLLKLFLGGICNCRCDKIRQLKRMLDNGLCLSELRS